MKFDYFIRLLVILSIVSCIFSRSHRNQSAAKNSANAHMKTNFWVKPLLKTAASYHSFANLPYCSGDIINKLACPLCSDILDHSYELFKFHQVQVKKYTYTFVILFSKNRNEVVISFAGPRDASPAFYSTLYSKGFRDYNGVNVENVFLDAFEGEFREKLEEYVKDYQSKFNADAKNHKYTFIGHSLGGALATLAAYDLVNSKTIGVNQELKSPIVYSYGALRLGDKDFVTKVNNMFKVVRVVKANDAYPRMPACTWSASLKKFRCEDVVNPTPKNTRPELLQYIQHYYGGSLHSSVEAAYDGGAMNMVEKKAKKLRHSSKQNGWNYSQNNPGYTVNNQANPFDVSGRLGDDGAVSYSQPLGAEVLYSNNFKKHTICSYFYGIPDCEKSISPELDKDDGKNYFNQNLTDC